MITAESAKKELVDGNNRFVSGKTMVKDISHAKRKDLVDHGQHPFALIVCCSDSRVPPEILFDQGLGDIFVIRSAGNVLDEVGLGSIEYGVEHLHIPLVVVLGHEQCGAVKATVDGENAHGSIKVILDKLRLPLDKLNNPVDVYEACADENTLNTISEIQNNSVVHHLLQDGKLEVIGAKYGICSGVVTFL